MFRRAFRSRSNVYLNEFVCQAKANLLAFTYWRIWYSNIGAVWKTYGQRNACKAEQKAKTCRSGLIFILRREKQMSRGVSARMVLALIYFLKNELKSHQGAKFQKMHWCRYPMGKTHSLCFDNFNCNHICFFFTEIYFFFKFVSILKSKRTVIGLNQFCFLWNQSVQKILLIEKINSKSCWKYFDFDLHTLYLSCKSEFARIIFWLLK